MFDPIVIKQVTQVFMAFAAFLCTPEVCNLSRMNAGDFTRNVGKLPLSRCLLYLIFRNCKDTNSELSKFFASIDRNSERPSRQAVNKRLRRVNSAVWTCLSAKFTELVYGSSKLATKLRGYSVWATDSSSLEMPYSKEAEAKFGMHRSNHSKKDSASGKILARCGGLYDVLNRFFIDYRIEAFNHSEMSIIINQLRMFAYMLSHHKIIILGDRGYISLQLMILMEKLGYSYCIRGKRSDYKAEVGRMKSNDEYVEIKITKIILSRITIPETRAYLEGCEVFRVRVVKKYWMNPKTGAEELTIYFTNLSPKEFNTDAIVDLYKLRWRIEIAYGVLKSILELERHISTNPEVALNVLYGKIMFYNCSALFREPLEQLITAEETVKSPDERNQYHYQVNAKVLTAQLYAENMVKCLIMGNDIAGHVSKLFEDLYVLRNKMKTPIRNDRHYERWGKPVTCSHKYRFRIDGRNHPKVALISGVLRTVKP